MVIIHDNLGIVCFLGWGVYKKAGYRNESCEDVDCFARLAKTFHFVFVFASEKARDAFARPCQLFCKKSDKVYSPCKGVEWQREKVIQYCVK